MKGVRRTVVVTSVAVLGAVLCGTRVSWADGPRRVAGALQVSGGAEVALGSGSWRPATSGALLEGMRVRTGADGAAVLRLTRGDILALGPNTTCAVARERIDLEEGRVALRLRAASGTAVETPHGTVRNSAVAPAGTGVQEAVVVVSAGGTAVEVARGRLELLAADGSVNPLLAGQVATVAPDVETPSVTLASATTMTSPTALDGGVMRPALALPFGVSPLVAGVVAGGVVVGGALGGAAASGAFSADDSVEVQGAGRQGSPFRPIRK